MATGKESEPDYALKETRDKSIFYYYDNNIGDEITPEFRKFIRAYGGVPDDKILSHVYEIRDKAWAIRAYPCIGQGLFLNPLITISPAYPAMLKKLKAGGRLVEVGSFIGHDLRRRVYDGAPSNNLYAVDTVSHWDVGFDMFNDRQKFHANFIESDIVHPTSQLPE